MERTIYTITRYDKELSRRFKRDEIKNYLPCSLIGYEDGSEILGEFEDLDEAKKAFAPFNKSSLEQYNSDKLRNEYSTPEHMTVTAENGDYIIGDMYGWDECFDGNAFYQYVVNSDGIYKAYYDVDNDTIIDEIDYSKATRIELISFDDITDII